MLRGALDICRAAKASQKLAIPLVTYNRNYARIVNRDLSTQIRKDSQTANTSHSLSGESWLKSENVKLRTKDVDAASSTLDVDSFKSSIRKGRPLSPHFTIYQPQITWIGSIFHRVTGAGLALVLYAAASVYVVYPYTPESLINFIHYIPNPVLMVLKASAVASFFYHLYNGIRHLIWDTTKQLKNNEVSYTGWTVVGLTAATTAGLILMK